MIRGITLLLITIVVGITACNKEAIVEPINPENIRLPFSPVQKVLFNYLEVDEANQTFKGWIIDKTGDIRAYDLNGVEHLNLIDLDKILTEDDLNAIYGMTTSTGLQIDIEELRIKHNLIDYMLNDEIEIAEEDETVEGTTYLIAYNHIYQRVQCGDSDCTANSTGKSIFTVKLLEAFGAMNMKNTLSSAEVLATWLKNVKADQNL